MMKALTKAEKVQEKRSNSPAGGKDVRQRTYKEKEQQT